MGRHPRLHPGSPGSGRGTLPDLPDAVFALGFSGYGNSIGLLAAERMVELALDGRDPGPISAARF